MFQCRLIVAQMSDTRCQVLNPFISVSLISLVGVLLANDPKVELSILWTITIAMTLAHIHYGIVVVSYKVWCSFVDSVRIAVIAKILYFTLVTSDGVHLCGLAPGQHSSEDTSRPLRAVGDS